MIGYASRAVGRPPWRVFLSSPRELRPPGRSFVAQLQRPAHHLMLSQGRPQLQHANSHLGSGASSSAPNPPEETQAAPSSSQGKGAPKQGKGAPSAPIGDAGRSRPPYRSSSRSRSRSPLRDVNWDTFVFDYKMDCLGLLLVAGCWWQRRLVPMVSLGQT